MNTSDLFLRYQELQIYVGWTEGDANRVQAAAPLLEPHLPGMIDDFYLQIEKFAQARKVITGGQAQIDRLKGTLLRWVRELLGGRYDEAYVDRRWWVGWRHVEIGLGQVYTIAALSRLRTGLNRQLQAEWRGEADLLSRTSRSLNTLIDLDLAIIEEAYQAENSLRLQRAERLSTLGHVAGGLAHELRNPLNVIKTSIYYLLHANAATPEKTAEHLKRIERQVDLADGVITALTTFARMPAPSLRPTSVQPCVNHALAAYPPGREVEVALDLPDELPLAQADRSQLQIVFSNLIRNASDAMPEGGRLTITGRAVGGTLEVAFVDDGPGIPASEITRILDPFYSTKSRGLGLGLALVRVILDKCGGQLKVESEPGRGSTFTVTLVASLAEASGESSA